MSEPKALTVAEPPPSPTNFLQIIAQAAANPAIDVDKMERLLAMQERMMAKQAEIDFNADLQTLQNTLPRVKKDSKIVHNGKLISNYASYEAIDDVIRPLLQEHGFSLRYDSEPSNGKLLISGTLAHRRGHSVTNKIELGIDSSGAKNNVQGVGSTIAYGKRYLIGMLLNLVFEGEDDDGEKAGTIAITAAQAEEIEALLKSSGADRRRFFEFFQVDRVDAIPARLFDTALLMLKRKAAR